MLYTGQKRWLMAPPARRLTSNAHLTEWIESGANGDEMECLKNAGDMLYLLRQTTVFVEVVIFSLG